jgi:hypothetical protein
MANLRSCWQNDKLRAWLRDQGLEMATDLLTAKVLSWYLMDTSHLQGTGFSIHDDLTIDHVVPQQLGGPCCIYNFVLMSRSTNSHFGKYYSKEKEGFLGPTICAAAENVTKLIRRQGLERAEITHFNPLASPCPQPTRKRVDRTDSVEESDGDEEVLAAAPQKRRKRKELQQSVQSVWDALKISIDSNPPTAEINRLVKCAEGYAEDEEQRTRCQGMSTGASLPAGISKGTWDIEDFGIVSCKASGQQSQDFANLRTVACVVNEWSQEYRPDEWYEYKYSNGSFRLFASTRASDALRRVANQVRESPLPKSRPLNGLL